MQASTMYYIHTDHLNTPRLIVNQAQQAVWRWDQAEPFGTYPANENPSGLGVFENNLRFPGQYFDKETGLHYNYFRDYDPPTGRYIQSDPIGLAGGINNYSYVRGNPISKMDPRGLEPGNLIQRGYVVKPLPFLLRPPKVPGEGCGDKDTDKYIPDLFPSACQDHDRCYDTLGCTKWECDSNFWWGSFTESGPWPNVITPTIYFLAVYVFGSDVYKDAQRQASGKK